MKRAVLVLAAMAIASMIRSYTITTVCSLEPSVATPQVVINPVADTGSVSQEPAVALIEQYAEALGYDQALRRVEIPNQDDEVAVTIYMPEICGD
ncbi:MAG: hypothetical protein ACR2QM_06585 [Longimicrobiales bacterium]